MKRIGPYGDENGAYVQGDASAGVKGSYIDYRAIEHAQLEIVKVIQMAGLTPSSADLTQLYQSIAALIAASTGSESHAFAANGYQKFPSGLVVQWGVITASIANETPTTYSFPITFPHACYAVVATGRYNGYEQDMSIGISLDTAPSTTGFTVYAINPNSPYPALPGFFWFAIGY